MQTLLEKLVALVSKKTNPEPADIIERLTGQWQLLASLMEVQGAGVWAPSMGNLLNAAVRACTLSLVISDPSIPDMRIVFFQLQACK